MTYDPETRSVSRIVTACLALGANSFTVEELAATLGIHRRSLLRRLSSCALPPTGTLIAMSRLVHAAVRLRDDDRSVEQVGLALGFGSGSGLRNMLRRYTGLTPADLRGPEGLDRMLAIFSAMLGGHQLDGHRASLGSRKP